MANSKREVLKILEDNELTNIYSPEDQIKLDLKKAKKVQTLEEQKTELEDSLNQSRYQELIRIEMDKIRAEGKMKEECTTDTHKIIYEAEKRVKEKEG